MATKHSRYTLILFALIAVGVIILVGALVIWQRQDAVAQQLTREYQTLDAQNKQIQQEITPEMIQQHTSELQELNAKLNSLDQNLVDYKYIPTYLRQIQSTAITTGNSIRSIQPRDLRPLDLKKSPLLADKAKVTAVVTPAAAPAADSAASTEQPAAAEAEKKVVSKYQVQQITLEVDGSYDNLLRLLDALRRFPKMVYVRTLNITPQLTNNVLSLSSHIETYAIITPDQYKQTETAKTVATGPMVINHIRIPAGYVSGAATAKRPTALGMKSKEGAQ